MSTLATTNIKHPSSASNNIVLDSAGGVDLDALTVSGSAPADSVNIDASGRLLVGTSTAFNNVQWFSTTYVAPIRQTAGSGHTAEGIFSYANSNVGGAFYFNKSRGATIGSDVIVAQNDVIGDVVFNGNDGTNFIRAASIRGEVDGTPGTNDMPGRLVFSTTADGASSPTERMRVNASGNVLIGKTSTAFDTAGTTFYGNQFPGAIDSARSNGYVLALNRLTNDGNIVEFYQDQVLEGSISVSGTTVSYNGAHLSRWSQLPSGVDRTEILRGSVLSNIDEMCEWGNEDNEQLNRMKVSDVEGDKNVSGVFQDWDDDDDTYTNDFYCAMTGDFIIRIGDGVTVERGDLLMSAGDGTAKPQDDDIIRSKTIAKVTSTNVSCLYDDGSYCVPCVLMAC